MQGAEFFKGQLENRNDKRPEEDCQGGREDKNHSGAERKELGVGKGRDWVGGRGTEKGSDIVVK